jgi:glycosyltransferase involved in cell wall biosynthesis
MNIAILFDAVRTNGGSYQMSINNLITLKDNLQKNNITPIILTHNKNVDLNKLKFKYEVVNLSFCDYLIVILHNIPLLNFFFFKICQTSPFEKKLLKKNINLVVFSIASWKLFLVKKIKFITTIMDTCHLDFKGTKYFKEINLLIYLYREYVYKKNLPLAYRVITESNFLKKKIIKFYKLKYKSVISIPNVPSLLLKSKKGLSITSIKKKFNISSSFYFYPAQFWEHKNHMIILEAVKILNLKNIYVKFIFCGKDKGNLKSIVKKIDEYQVKKNVKIIDYVNDEELLLLYKLSKALIMPTYFGPTNIPPIEAWSLHVPVAYSSLNRNHGKNAAIYFNPDSPNELVDVILKLEKNINIKKLIKNGKKRLEDLCRENFRGHDKFLKDIKQCYKKNLMI